VINFVPKLLLLLVVTKLIVQWKPKVLVHKITCFFETLRYLFGEKMVLCKPKVLVHKIPCCFEALRYLFTKFPVLLKPTGTCSSDSQVL
jgi:hypothetical protein